MVTGVAPGDSIWDGLDPFRSRARRQAADYVAFIRGLTRSNDPSPEVDEFLALHEFVGACGEAGVAVHGDPYARLWTRIAFALLRELRGQGRVPAAAEPFANERGTRSVEALLAAHLREFKRLALGAAFLSGRPLAFRTPLEVALPTAVPGAAASLVGRGRVEVLGHADGRLETSQGWVSPVPCPRARVGEFELPLQPHGYAVPGLGWMPTAGKTDHAYQASQVPLVEAGLRLVAQHVPRMFRQMRAVLRWIALNPMSEYTGTNYVSFSELPGAFAFRAVPNPYSAAEACIHEFHHNRLFALEGEEALLTAAPGARDVDAIYYSPWRDEPRPIRGLLHAVYVTLAQTELWLSVFADPDTPEDVRHFATDQLVRHPLMIEIGLRQLDRFAPFTTAGRRFFGGLQETQEAHRRAAERLGVPTDAPLHFFNDDGSIRPAKREDGEPRGVRELVESHVADYDTRLQTSARLA